MSRRIDYNNENKLTDANRATIAPNAAPAVATVKPTGKTSLTYKIIAIVLIVLAVLAIALLVVNSIINSYVAKINTPNYEDLDIKIAPEISNKNAELYASMGVEGYDEVFMNVLLNYAEASHSVVENENIYNVAIYGINKFADSKDNGIASFIMVASFNKQTKNVTYAVFNERVLTYIPKVGVGGLQDAYEWGGAALLSKTIKHNFGIDVNGFIELDMTVAEKVIDNAGGLAIVGASEQKVNDAINSYNKKFNLSVPNAVVANGKATLTGAQAMAYLRADYEDSNIVAKAVGDTIFKLGFCGVLKSGKMILEGTNMSINREDFISVGRMAISVLKNADTKFVNIGYTTTTTVSFNKANNRVVYCDTEAERATLFNALYATDAE